MAFHRQGMENNTDTDTGTDTNSYGNLSTALDGRVMQGRHSIVVACSHVSPTPYQLAGHLILAPVGRPVQSSPAVAVCRIDSSAALEQACGDGGAAFLRGSVQRCAA